MLQIEVTLNIFLIAAFFVFAFLLGYKLFSSSAKSKDKRITELEKEMLSSHAEILQLQREKVELMKKIQETPTRVISLPSKDLGERPQEVTTTHKAAGQ